MSIMWYVVFLMGYWSGLSSQGCQYNLRTATWSCPEPSGVTFTPSPTRKGESDGTRPFRNTSLMRRENGSFELSLVHYDNSSELYRRHHSCSGVDCSRNGRKICGSRDSRDFDFQPAKRFRSYAVRELKRGENFGCLVSV